MPRPVRTVIATVGGPWEVSFPPNIGGTARIRLAALKSWTASADDGVKYFSGTATYTKTVHAPTNWFPKGSKIVLSLGVVRDIAEVSVNGKPLTTLWKPPYEVDVTGAS